MCLLGSSSVKAILIKTKKAQIPLPTRHLLLCFIKLIMSFIKRSAKQRVSGPRIERILTFLALIA